MNIFIKKTALTIAIVIGFTIVFFLISVRKVQPTEAVQKKMLKQLGVINLNETTTSNIKVGWAKENITPKYLSNMAGYGLRKTNIAHDSLYLRVMIFETINPIQKFVFLNIDLLIFPPELSRMLLSDFSKIGIPEDRIYMTATHTHNGFGNWDNSLISKFTIGNYSSKLMTILKTKMLKAVQQANKNTDFAHISYQETDIKEWVRNRLSSKGKVDSKLRIINIIRKDKQTACITNFSAHPTCLNASNKVFSRDYPGVLVDHLEYDSSIDFAIFTSGAVASHSVKSHNLKDFQLTDSLGKLLANKILAINKNQVLKPLNTIFSKRINLKIPKSQMHIGKGWVIRPWLFELLMGKLKAHVSLFRLNNITFIGLPCDFSGEIALERELYLKAKTYNQNLILSSFNGAYIGYITLDRYYLTKNHSEVKEMNWFGQGGENYFGSLIERIISFE